MAVCWRLAARFRDSRVASALWRKRDCTLGQNLPDSAGFESLSRAAAKAWATKASFRANRVLERIDEEEVQEFLWQKFFSDPTQWWDNRRNIGTPRHPDFRHKKSKEALRLNNCYKPPWVDSHLTMLDAQLDAGIRQPPGSLASSGRETPGRLSAHKGVLEVGRLRSLVEQGQVSEAVDALDLLVQRRCPLDSNLFYCVLKRCILEKDLVLGRRIHALSVESGYEGNAFLANHLIGLYALDGRLEEAMQVFSKVPTPDIYMWASMISAYARHGQPTQAIELYRQMCESSVKPDNCVFVAVLKACATAGDVAAGKDVHAHILASAQKPDMFVTNSLVHMYSKCGSLEDARKVFDRVPYRTVVTWNTMIAGYAQKGMGQEALRLYDVMQQEGIAAPDCATFVSILQACASVAALRQGRQLHAQIEDAGLQTDVVVGAGLVNMYVKCGILEDAQRVFDRLLHKDVVTWTAMMTGYAQQGMGQEALHLYSSMQLEGITPPDSFTFVCLLHACAGIGVAALHQGKQFHAQMDQLGVQTDGAVGASLVNMYTKCGSLEDAQRAFDRLSHKDVVTWNTMIGGYAQKGMGYDALSLYSSMQQECINPPDSVTFVFLLQACASVAALPLGKHLHAQIEELGLIADPIIGSSLVSMYAKCGSIVDSQQVFDALLERDVVTWNALIAAYSRQGDSEVVFDVVDKMKQDGKQPNGSTFLSVLTVCSHVGLVEMGRKYFGAMSTDYGISPTIEHYTCIVDLLGRAGHLDEALQVVKSMPLEPTGAVWLTLLAGCQKWSAVEIGRQAFEFAVKLDEKDAAPYVLMAHIYASAQMWDEAKEMQERRVKSGAWKQPGQSWWTDMDGVVHTFVVGDKEHSK